VTDLGDGLLDVTGDTEKLHPYAQPILPAAPAELLTHGRGCTSLDDLPAAPESQKGNAVSALPEPRRPAPDER
jgi:hypothetical protein